MSLLANIARGVMGLELSLQRNSTIRELTAPTTTIATTSGQQFNVSGDWDVYCSDGDLAAVLRRPLRHRPA